MRSRFRVVAFTLVAWEKVALLTGPLGKEYQKIVGETTWRQSRREGGAGGGICPGAAHFLGRHFLEIVTVKPQKICSKYGFWVFKLRKFSRLASLAAFFCFQPYSVIISAILTWLSLDFLSFSTWWEIWLNFLSHNQMSDRCVCEGGGGVKEGCQPPPPTPQEAIFKERGGGSGHFSENRGGIYPFAPGWQNSTWRLCMEKKRFLCTCLKNSDKWTDFEK